MLVVNARFLTQKISGVQRYAIEISKELKKLNYDVKFITPKNVIHHTLAEELGAEICGTFTGHLWEQIDFYLYLLRNNRPLLLNFSGLSPLMYEKKIITVHDLAFIRHPEWFSKKFYYFYKNLLPFAITNSIAVITVSDFSKNEINQLLQYSLDRIYVVYNSVLKNSQKIINNDFLKRPYILSVSSIDLRKNFKNLILAFNKLDVNDYDLVIIGAESSVFKKQNLWKLISNNNSIHFTGYLSDDELYLYYKNAALFIYPSLYEGFGIPPIEAMAFGCPTIVSNTTSLPEVCGDASFYVDPYDISDIALGMKTVLNNDSMRNELIKRGYERIKLFSWQKSALKIVEIIEKYETLEKSIAINPTS